MRPFAQARAFLPVPVLVIRANDGLIAPALAANRVPGLIFGANVAPWAIAGANIEAEVAWRHAFNMLLALASAGTGVPVPWLVTSIVNTIARRLRVVFRHNVDIQGAGAAHACLEVQD